MLKDLKKIKDLKEEKRTALVYAEPGQGKTTLLGQLPGKTLIFDIDKGTSVLWDCKSDVTILSLKENLSNLIPALEYLEKKCEYDNVCIDTLTELEKQMLTVYGQSGKNDGAPELQHYNKVQFKLIDLCRRFRALNANVVFTAWEKQIEEIARDGTKTTKAVPMLSGKTVNSICGLCDIVGYLQLSDKTNDRYVRLSKSHGFIARDRIYKREYCKTNELFLKEEIKNVKLEV